MLKRSVQDDQHFLESFSRTLQIEPKMEELVTEPNWGPLTCLQ